MICIEAMIAMIIPMKNRRYVNKSNVHRDNFNVEINNAYPMKLFVMAFEIVRTAVMNQAAVVWK